MPACDPITFDLNINYIILHIEDTKKADAAISILLLSNRSIKNAVKQMIAQPFYSAPIFLLSKLYCFATSLKSSNAGNVTSTGCPGLLMVASISMLIVASSPLISIVQSNFNFVAVK